MTLTQIFDQAAAQPGKMGYYDLPKDLSAASLGPEIVAYNEAHNCKLAVSTAVVDGNPKLQVMAVKSGEGNNS